MKNVLPLLEQISKSSKPLSSSLRTSRAKALATLVVNKLRGTLQVCAVKAPGFGDRRKAMLQDIATLTGGKAITEDLGIKLENVQMADLGQAKKITVDKANTTVIECPSFQVLDSTPRCLAPDSRGWKPDRGLHT